MISETSWDLPGLWLVWDVTWDDSVSAAQQCLHVVSAVSVKNVS